MSKALKFIGTLLIRESYSALVLVPDPTLQLSFLLVPLLVHEVWWDGALLCYCSQDWFNALIHHPLHYHYNDDNKRVPKMSSLSSSG